MRITTLCWTALLVLLAAAQMQASEEEVGRQTIRVGILSLGARTAITIIPQNEASASIPGTSAKALCIRSGTKLTVRWRSASEVSCEGVSTAPALRISCPGLLAVADRLYPNTIEVWPDPNGHLTVINEVPLESYVRGVLLAEGTSSMHPEALKALAVAARSYALASLNKHAALGFDVCDTTHCQGYRPYRPNPKVEAAVSATAGEVLLSSDGPIVAAYCTDCGGATANNEDAGFGTSPKPYLRGVRDAPAGKPNYCAASRYQSWRREFDLDDIAKRLALAPSAGLAYITGVSFEDPDQFGRAKTVVIRGYEHAPASTPTSDPASEQKEPPLLVTRSIPAPLFRRIMGETRLPSTAASARVLPGHRLEVTGRGFGHGVGMCLAGADGMARPPHNARYREILAHYYTSAVLTRLAPPAELISTARPSNTKRRTPPPLLPQPRLPRPCVPPSTVFPKRSSETRAR